jgi:hypothetical protein
MRAMTSSPLRHATCLFAAVALAAAAALSAPLACGAEPKAAAAALLSGEQWAKIRKQMDENGKIRTLPFKVAEYLGLTRGTETLTVRELAFERDGYQHGIYKSVDPKDERIILAFRTPEKRWTAFVTDTRFRLIGAIVWNAGETPVPWPNDQASPVFNNELGYWSVLAELL